MVKKMEVIDIIIKEANKMPAFYGMLFLHAYKVGYINEDDRKKRLETLSNSVMWRKSFMRYDASPATKIHDIWFDIKNKLEELKVKFNGL